MRSTIDFGIDLGVAKGVIAVRNGSNVDIIRNSEGQEYTPSAVWIDKQRRIIVGRRAKERLENDSENAYSEFKLQMGTSQAYRFAASGRRILPEELTAELIKSLRSDAQQRTGEDVIAAVISVPAAFEMPQCAATDRAAKMAGLFYSPLITEPAATAIAYGFQNKRDNAYWMVYDIGGGTFDVALIQIRDSLVNVASHNGDNQLGGKLIDWEIVERLFVPALRKEYALTDFDRGNPKWRVAFAKLKFHAEQAKMQLLGDTATDIFIEPLCQDDRGNLVNFNYELTRSEVALVVEPIVERSVELCWKTLKEKELTPGDIEKVILVGDTSINPLFREMLAARLQIPLEFSLDPATVIAQGAAIFAGMQPMPPDIIKKQRPKAEGQYVIDLLNYKPIGNDPEPLVGGFVTVPRGESLTSFTVEFIEAKTQWRSGKISLSAEGKFMTNLHAVKGTNEVFIELRDSAGKICHTAPEKFNYTLSVGIVDLSLINSIGIGQPDGRMQIFLRKGTLLPARHRENHRTTVALRQGQSGTILKYPIYEGEFTRRADRNMLIGTLEISATNIRRDLPAGSEIEITIEVNEARLIIVKAYINILDEEYKYILKFKIERPDSKQLANDFKKEIIRLEKVQGQMKRLGVADAERALLRIQDEGMVHDIDVLLAEAETDPDAAFKCEKRLRDLQIAIDEAEDAVEWPALVSNAEETLENTRETVKTYGQKNDLEKLGSLEMEMRGVIKSHDMDSLRRKIDQMEGLRLKLYFDQPYTWKAFFEYLEQNKSQIRDKALAEQLCTQARRAIENNNIDQLKSVVRRLVDIMEWTIQPNRIWADYQKKH